MYLSVDGVLKAVVKQKTPIARVDNNSSFILIMKNKMSLSNFTARVPLVSGN
jgi:cell division protein FtsQ